MLASALQAALPLLKLSKKVATVHRAAASAPRKNAKLIAGHGLEMASIITTSLHLDVISLFTGLAGVGLILHHVLNSEVIKDDAD